MANFGSILKDLRTSRGITQGELATMLEVSRSTVGMYETGGREPDFETMEAIADIFNVDMDYLMGRSQVERKHPISPPRKEIPPGFQPLPEMAQVPLIGSIACGTPITAEQNIKSYIGVPAAWRADFALECHGDSMAPTICDGDVVCIRSQPEVEQGQIAAVRIGEEATLKHCYYQNGVVQLIADNPAVCPPMVYTGPDLEDIEVEGLAVGFCRGLV
jgi:repressor LexA